MERFEKFWPADVHLVGKDILRFHAVYWPAFLMASGLPLPRTVYGHGWWLKDDTKMSKSKGNVLDPHVLLKVFGPDPLRYFLLREIPIGQDGNFSHEGFLHRVNSDLANDFGNLVQRTLTMIGNYFGGEITAPDAETAEDARVRTDFDELKGRVFDLYDACALNRALEEIWAYIGRVNKYLAENEPWIMAKDASRRPRLARVLLQAAAAIRGRELSRLSRHAPVGRDSLGLPRTSRKSPRRSVGTLLISAASAPAGRSARRRRSSRGSP